MDDDIPYLLLTPGPLTTSKTVKAVMMQDYCTWDEDYNRIVQRIRERLVRLVADDNDATAVLMQGSGTFAVEATIGSVIPPDGKLLVVNNGAYGKRIAMIAARLGIEHTEITFSETEPADPDTIGRALAADSQITHVALVHCETTTGMLNDVRGVGALVDEYGKTFVPGFGFVIADRARLEETAGCARSLSLDLFAQWAWSTRDFAACSRGNSIRRSSRRFSTLRTRATSGGVSTTRSRRGGS